MDEVRELILSTEGKIFSATVVKRSTGLERTIVGRLFDGSNDEIDQRNNQLKVIDMQATKEIGVKQIRTIAIERLLHFNCFGRSWQVKNIVRSNQWAIQ